MELPAVAEVRSDYLRVIENVNFLIETINTKDNLSFFGYLAQFGTINIEFIKLGGKINGLIAGYSISSIKETGSFKVNRNYSKAFEKHRKIEIKMMIDTRKIEDKYLKGRYDSWEHIYQTSNMRKELINHFRAVSKDLGKVLKNLTLKP